MSADLIKLNEARPSFSREIKNIFDPSPIPKNLGRVSEVWGESKPSVILIQDAHGQYQAQKNIQSILKLIQERGRIENLFIEGGVGKLDSELLKWDADPAKNQKLLDLLARRAEIGGPELFWAENAQIPAYGTEDPEIYSKNLRAFQQVYSRQEEVKSAVESESLELQTRASKKTSPEFYAFFKSWLRYELSESKDLAQHLGALKENAKKYLELDLQDPREQLFWPMLVRFFEIKARETKLNNSKIKQEEEKLADWIKEQSVPAVSLPSSKTAARREFWESFYEKYHGLGFEFADYPAYFLAQGSLILSEELEARELFGEAEKLCGSILAKQAKTQEEKRFVEKAKSLIFTQKLLRLELTREDYGNYLNGEFEKGNVLSEIRQTALDFYKLASYRDEIMVRNVEVKTSGSGSVLIAGGFHTAGLTKLLRNKSISYAVITPHFSEIQDSADYEASMMGRAPKWDLGSSTLRNANLATPAKAWRGYLPSGNLNRRIQISKVLAGSRAEIRTDSDPSAESLKGTAADYEELNRVIDRFLFNAPRDSWKKISYITADNVRVNSYPVIHFESTSGLRQSLAGMRSRTIAPYEWEIQGDLLLIRSSQNYWRNDLPNYLTKMKKDDETAGATLQRKGAAEQFLDLFEERYQASERDLSAAAEAFGVSDLKFFEALLRELGYEWRLGYRFMPLTPEVMAELPALEPGARILKILQARGMVTQTDLVRAVEKVTGEKIPRNTMAGLVNRKGEPQREAIHRFALIAKTLQIDPMILIAGKTIEQGALHGLTVSQKIHRLRLRFGWYEHELGQALDQEAGRLGITIFQGKHEDSKRNMVKEWEKRSVPDESFWPAFENVFGEEGIFIPLAIQTAAKQMEEKAEAGNLEFADEGQKIITAAQEHLESIKPQPYKVLVQWVSRRVKKAEMAYRKARRTSLNVGWIRLINEETNKIQPLLDKLKALNAAQKVVLPEDETTVSPAESVQTDEKVPEPGPDSRHEIRGVSDPNRIFLLLGPDMDTQVPLIDPVYLNEEDEARHASRIEKEALAIINQFQMFFLHGNILLDKKTQQAVVIMGANGTGKSLLTKKLTESGHFEFAQDDSIIAFFDRAGKLFVGPASYRVNPPIYRDREGKFEFYSRPSDVKYQFSPVNALVLLSKDPAAKNYFLQSGFEGRQDWIIPTELGTPITVAARIQNMPIFGIHARIPEEKENRDYDGLANEIGALLEPHFREKFAGYGGPLPRSIVASDGTYFSVRYHANKENHRVEIYHDKDMVGSLNFLIVEWGGRFHAYAENTSISVAAHYQAEYEGIGETIMRLAYQMAWQKGAVDFTVYDNAWMYNYFVQKARMLPLSFSHFWLPLDPEEIRNYGVIPPSIGINSRHGLGHLELAPFDAATIMSMQHFEPENAVIADPWQRAWDYPPTRPEIRTASEEMPRFYAKVLLSAGSIKYSIFNATAIFKPINEAAGKKVARYKYYQTALQTALDRLASNGYLRASRRGSPLYELEKKGRELLKQAKSQPDPEAFLTDTLKTMPIPVKRKENAKRAEIRTQRTILDDIVDEIIAEAGAMTQGILDSNAWTFDRPFYNVGGSRYLVLGAISHIVRHVLTTYLQEPVEKIIDVSAGEGFGADVLGIDWVPQRYTAYDINSNFLDRIKEKGRASQIISGSIYELSSRVRDAQALISFDAYDTYEDLHEAVRQTYEALQPGGIFFNFQTLNVDPHPHFRGTYAEEFRKLGIIYSPELDTYFRDIEQLRSVLRFYVLASRFGTMGDMMDPSYQNLTMLRNKYRVPVNLEIFLPRLERALRENNFEVLFAQPLGAQYLVAPQPRHLRAMNESGNSALVQISNHLAWRHGQIEFGVVQDYAQGGQIFTFPKDKIMEDAQILAFAARKPRPEIRTNTVQAFDLHEIQYQPDAVWAEAVAAVERVFADDPLYQAVVLPGNPEGIYINIYPRDAEIRARLKKIELEAALERIQVPSGSVAQAILSIIDVEGKPFIYVEKMQPSYGIRHFEQMEREAFVPYKGWTDWFVKKVQKTAASLNYEGFYAKPRSLAMIQNPEMPGGNASEFYTKPYNKNRGVKKKVSFRNMYKSWKELADSVAHEIHVYRTPRYLFGGEWELWYLEANPQRPEIREAQGSENPDRVVITNREKDPRDEGFKKIDGGPLELEPKVSLYEIFQKNEIRLFGVFKDFLETLISELELNAEERSRKGMLSKGVELYQTQGANGQARLALKVSFSQRGLRAESFWGMLKRKAEKFLEEGPRFLVRTSETGDGSEHGYSYVNKGSAMRAVGILMNTTTVRLEYERKENDLITTEMWVDLNPLYPDETGEKAIGLRPEIRTAAAKENPKWRRVLAHYDLGEIHSLKAMPSKSPHGATVKVVSDRGVYYLKPNVPYYFDNHRESLLFEIHLNQTLLEKGFPVPALVPTKQKVNGRPNYWVEGEENTIYRLFEEKPGVLVKASEFSKTQWESNVDMLAKIHSAMKDFKPQDKRTRFDLVDFSEERELLRKKRDEMAEEKQAGKNAVWTPAEKFLDENIPFLLEQIELLEQNLVPYFNDLPTTVIHGDYNPRNILFSGENLSAVLDWDNAAIGPRIWDFFAAGSGLFQKWIEGVGYNFPGLEKMIARYEQTESLTDLEKNLLPEFARLRALRSAARMARYGDLYKSDIEKHHLQNLPLQEVGFKLMDRDASFFSEIENTMNQLKSLDAKLKQLRPEIRGTGEPSKIAKRRFPKITLRKAMILFGVFGILLAAYFPDYSFLPLKIRLMRASHQQNFLGIDRSDLIAVLDLKIKIRDLRRRFIENWEGIRPKVQADFPNLNLTNIAKQEIIITPTRKPSKFNYDTVEGIVTVIFEDSGGKTAVDFYLGKHLHYFKNSAMIAEPLKKKDVFGLYQFQSQIGYAKGGIQTNELSIRGEGLKIIYQPEFMDQVKVFDPGEEKITPKLSKWLRQQYSGTPGWETEDSLGYPPSYIDIYKPGDPAYDVFLKHAAEMMEKLLKLRAENKDIPDVLKERDQKILTKQIEFLKSQFQVYPRPEFRAKGEGRKRSEMRRKNAADLKITKNNKINVRESSRAELRTNAVLRVAKNVTNRILAAGSGLYEKLFPKKDPEEKMTEEELARMTAAYVKLFEGRGSVVIPAEALHHLSDSSFAEYWKPILNALNQKQTKGPKIYIAGDSDGKIRNKVLTGDFLKAYPLLRNRIKNFIRIENQQMALVLDRLKELPSVSVWDAARGVEKAALKIPGFLLRADEIKELEGIQYLRYLHSITQLQFLVASQFEGIPAGLHRERAEFLTARALTQAGVKFQLDSEGFFRPDRDSLLTGDLAARIASSRLSAQAA